MKSPLLSGVGKYKNYLTFRLYSNDNGDTAEATISFVNTGDAFNKLDLYYRTSRTSWEKVTDVSTVFTLREKHDYIQLWNKTNNWSKAVNNFLRIETGGGDIMASGSVMSLLNFSDTLPNCCFYMLFSGCTNLRIPPELPSVQELSSHCYYYMFSNSGILFCPELSACTLASSCYEGMFSSCPRLTAPAELPAETLAFRCYYAMFSSCVNISDPPVLPATKLDEHCYSYMFNGCTGLRTAPELPADVTEYSCYRGMFQNCTSLVNPPALSSKDLAPYCYAYMFSGCSSLLTTPELPATVMADSCYSSMFSGCSAIRESVKLPGTHLDYNCYYAMFSNCTALTKVQDAFKATPWNGSYAYMFNGCTSLRVAPKLPDSVSFSVGGFRGMFQGCANLEQAPELPATKLSKECYAYMFSGCSNLTTAPELPATELEEDCYLAMFTGCTKLNAINVSFSAWEPSTATTAWVTGVSSTGVFTKPASLATLHDDSKIPVGWTVVNK